MRIAVRRSLAIGLVVVTMTGCATVSHGPMQRIHVDSDPPATVYTRECGPGSTKRAETPAVVWVSRRAERCALTFEVEGYEPQTRLLRRTVSERTLHNIEAADDLCEFSDCRDLSDWFAVTMAAAILVGAGVGIDAATGAMFRQEPSEVVVRLRER